MQGWTPSPCDGGVNLSSTCAKVLLHLFTSCSIRSADMSAAKNALSKVSGKSIYIQVYPPHFTHTQCVSPHLYRYRLQYHALCVRACVFRVSVSIRTYTVYKLHLKESFETRWAHVECIINAIGIHYSGLAREVQLWIQHTYVYISCTQTTGCGVCAALHLVQVVHTYVHTYCIQSLGTLCQAVL